ncbi:uncharacterized protein METZ01_LOCUS249796 [marine metagenome]|uniref:Uncharacterized protein n=1 Tax=marine metagenome TaxID=408172 RepID=A0A382ICD2_9ZZZZ
MTKKLTKFHGFDYMKRLYQLIVCINSFILLNSGIYELILNYVS